jgi:RHS repeat-associated protein
VSAAAVPNAGTTTLQTNTWYHIVAVIRGAADMDIYINADNDGGTYSRTGGSIAYSTSSASIARIRFASSDNEFNGKIDDVRVFNAALSEQDAEQLYQNQSPGEVYYYHYDALGSVVALSNSAGDTVQAYQYSVYGQVAASDPNFTANPYLFTARRFDYETGLYYYRARYYNPYIGRLLQTDPVGYSAGMNLYAYCMNNPICITDPFGHDPCDPCDPSDFISRSSEEIFDGTQSSEGIPGTMGDVAEVVSIMLIGTTPDYTTMDDGLLEHAFYHQDYVFEYLPLKATRLPKTFCHEV